MKKLLGLGLVVCVVLFGSCSDENSPSSIADGMCECLKDAGLSSSTTLYGVNENRGFQRKGEACVEKYGAKLRKGLEEKKNKKERAAYMKELLQASLGTECSDIALKMVPYDLMLEGMDDFGLGGFAEEDYYEEEDAYDSEYREGDRKRERKDTSADDHPTPGDYPTACDCANSDGDEKVAELCREKYDLDKMSQEEVKELMEQMEDCLD
jgi:hypothetical protein